MVVANRVAWIRQSIVNGVHVCLHIGAAQDPGKCKVRATIDPHKGRLCITTRTMLLATLDSLNLTSDQLTVMDRGHRHSSGISEACFWSQQTGIGSRNDDDVDVDDEDDDVDEGPKRKLQPGGKDPWLDGCDPWSSARSSARPLGQPSPRSSNMSKRPRNHTADMVFDICDSDGDDSADSEAAPLDLEGDFKFLPDVQQQLERNASSDGNTKSVDAISYGGSIADSAPAVDSETDGCAVSVSLSADDGRKILRAIQSMTERIENNLIDSAAAAVSLSTVRLDEGLARMMREMTHMNQICLEAAHVRPSCTNG